MHPFRCTRTRRSVALWLLACLLFTQAALAAACVSPSASAQDAFAPAPVPCHETPPANLCLAHCTAADQSSGPPATALAPPLAVLIEVVPIPTSVAAPTARRPGVAPDVRALGPPPFRRLCSLLL